MISRAEWILASMLLAMDDLKSMGLAEGGGVDVVDREPIEKIVNQGIAQKFGLAPTAKEMGDCTKVIESWAITRQEKGA